MKKNKETENPQKSLEIKYYIPNKCKFRKFINEPIEQNKDKRKSEKLDINKLTQSFYIVTAKPGIGKSRLLKQIVLDAYEKDIKAFFIDLKKVNLNVQNPILTTIQNYAKRDAYKIAENIDDYQLKKKYKDCIYTPNFNFEDAIVCLDALDEVDAKSQFEIIEAIKEFISTNIDVKLILSCRTYIYERFEHVFNEFNPHFIELQPLTFLQVEKYFELRGISKLDIEIISKKFRYYSAYLPKHKLIDTPRILEIFTDLILKDGVKITLSKTQTELYETFIYKKLEEEERKKNSNHKTIVKRVLEKLALTMAIYQVKQITEDELMTFLDGIQSNLSVTLLHQISLNTFYERSLLIRNNDKIEFENAEFQEYLAAKELSRLNHLEQVVFDVVFDIELDEFYPNLLYTFKHIIDFKPNLLPKIVDFIHKRKSKLDCGTLSYILPTQLKIVSQIENHKFDIFKKTIETSWNNQVPIWYHNTIEKLAYFYDNKVELYLIDLVKQKKLKSHKDIYSLIRDFNEDSTVNINKLRWKQIYIDFLNSEDFPEDLSYSIFNFLATFNDIDLFKSMDKSLYESDKRIKEQFIRACCKINPNDRFTIDLLFDALSNRTFNIHPFPTAFKITTYDGFLYLFQKINSDDKYRQCVEVDKWEKYKLDDFFENLKNVYNEVIEVELFRFLEKSYFWKQEQLDIINGIVTLIKQVNKNYVVDVIKYLKIIKDNRYWKQGDLLNQFIEKSNIEQFIELLSYNNDLLNYILGTLYHDKENTEVKNIVFNLEPSKLDNIIKESEKRQKERELKAQKGKLKIYKLFQEKLEPEPGFYKTNVCQFYKNQKETIDKFITGTEQERLKKLVTEIIFSFEFKNHASITANKIDNSYTVTESINIFRTALGIIHHFVDDLQPYRAKIIEYLPFAIDNHFEKNVLDILEQLTEAEVEQLIEFYQQERSDDLLYFNVRNLFTTIERFKIIQLIPLLKKIVKDDRYDGYDVNKAIELIFEFTEDFNYLNELSITFSNQDILKNRLVLPIINRLLVSKENPYKEQVILNVIKIIKDLANKYNTLKPSEIWREQYTYEHIDSSLQIIKQQKYLDNFLNLLEYSFECLKKDEKYLKYSNYIWSICFNYFEKLVHYNSILALKKIENLYIANQKLKGIDAFAKLYNDLKNKYLADSRKPLNIQVAINQYNEMKAKSYLPIYNAEGLLFLIREILNQDIRNFIEQEGFYHTIGKYTYQEELIQKTIKSQFENALLKRGFRATEVNIRREEQLLDDLRTDFIISYGYIGQVLIEIKLAKNKELKDEASMINYKDKLIQYIDGTNSNFGIFLIFQTDEKRLWSDLKIELNDIYKDENDIRIMGYNCLKSHEEA